MQAETQSIERTLTQDDFDCFARLSGDDNPIHVDPDFAARTRFGRTVAHGMLLGSVLRGLVDRMLPGAVQIDQELMFPAPAFANTTFRFDARLLSRTDGMATVQLACTSVNDDTLTCSGKTTLQLARDTL
jgi:acyl dehydratase